MRKWISIMIIVVMVLSMQACGTTPISSPTTVASTEAATVASTEAAPVAAATIPLTVFSKQSSAIQDFDKNDLTIMIEKKFNVDLQWILTPGDAALEKQNVLLASGDYPNAFFSGEFNQNDQIKYGSEGILVPLNPLIASNGSNITAAFTNSPYMLKGATAPDGNIYSLPSLEECYHCDYAQKMYINVRWLEKLNLKMPTTTEELTAVLTAFRDKDPNGNGLKDEIPLTGCTKWWHGEPTNFLMCSFIYATDADILTLNNGVVDISANKPEWKEGLSYIKKLYSEKLIDPQAYTQAIEGMQKIADNPDTVIMGAFTGGCCVPTVGPDGRWAQYEVVPPPAGPKGVQYIGYFGEGVGNGIFAITKSASPEQQLAAINICNYLFSKEGSLDEMYGPKDIGWWDVKAEDNLKGVDGNAASYTAVEPYQREDKRSVTWDNGLKYTPASLFNGRVQNQDITKPDGFERYLAVQTDKLIKFKPKEVFPQAIWLKPEDAQKLAQIKVDVRNYIDTNALQFITGQKDLEADWDAYVKGFEGLGLAEFVKANQEAYDTQYK
jgi:putative aldouronate transport system substrate-binding protein